MLSSGMNWGWKACWVWLGRHPSFVPPEGLLRAEDPYHSPAGAPSLELRASDSDTHTELGPLGASQRCLEMMKSQSPQPQSSFP